MKKIFLIALLLITSSCIKIDIQQEIMSDGKSKVTIRTDMEAFRSLIDSGEPCSGRYNSLDNPFCYVENGTIVQGGELDLAELGLIKIEKSFFTVRYEYDALNILKVMQRFRTDEEITKESIKEMQQQIADSRIFGREDIIEINYMIIMPGLMQDPGFGTFEDNKVSVPFLELADQKETKLVSYGVNLNSLLILTALAAIGLTISFFMFLRKG